MRFIVHVEIQVLGDAASGVSRKIFRFSRLSWFCDDEYGFCFRVFWLFRPDDLPQLEQIVWSKCPYHKRYQNNPSNNNT